MNRRERVNWVYASKDNDELAERYDRWAEDYEQDLIEVYGRVVRDPFVDSVMRHVAKDASILDAGVGTGLLGACLYQYGYRHLVGIDLSEGMLAQARRKNIYQALHRMVLGEPLDFAAGEFDATICAGVFTPGHAPASALEELIRVTRPGGLILFTIRPDYYQESAFRDLLPSLERAGRLRLVDNGVRYQAAPKAEPDLILQVWVYEIG
jgi:SAM-dependent methyltransferase